MKKALLARLFAGGHDTFVACCLSGRMGYYIESADESAAQMVVGDFCFFAGRADPELAKKAAAPILVPCDEAWEKAIEAALGGSVERASRYYVSPPEKGFSVGRLQRLSAPPPGYTLRLFDKELYHQALNAQWSKDLCSQFINEDDYRLRGLGVAVLKAGKMVAGASSYIVYPGGIEIEIDAEPAERGKGLATACGARLILYCLERGLIPHWDAFDLRSLHLAQKLGYTAGNAYTVYIKRSFSVL